MKKGGVYLIIGLLVNSLLIYTFLHINKFNPKKVKLTIISTIATIITAVIPALGYEQRMGSYYFGYPADILAYHGDMLVSFVSFGLLFNFFFFYWLFKLISWVGRFISPVKKGEY